MPKAVMFDCYNTLLRYESEEDKEKIWDMMLHAIEYVMEKKFSITPENLEALYLKEYKKEVNASQKARGKYAEICLKNVWRGVLVALNISRQIAEEKAEDMLLLHRIYTRKKRHLFPNVEKELMVLKRRGIKLLLLSNAQTCFIYNELPEEIRDIFDVVLISEKVGIKKPDETIFLQALQALNTEAEETVFVGDSAEDDMIPASKLGCHCVMIGKEKVKEHIPAHVILFDPYKESGYESFSKLVFSMN